MESDLLDKLKIKPSLTESPPTVSLKTQITLGPTDDTFNYDDFIQRIKRRGIDTRSFVLGKSAPVDIEKIDTTKSSDKSKPKIKIIARRKAKIKPSLKGTITRAANITEQPSKIIQKFDSSLYEEFMLDRIKEPEEIRVRADKYYLNNREYFVSFINSLFQPYKEQLENDEKLLSCDSRKGEFSLLTHQKIVRDYINSWTPYRGVLLYHGLGSGKTCSSISIAEGLKTDKQIIVMTPASLRMNYIQELQVCGDQLYKKNQYWEFISTTDKPKLIPILAKSLNLDETVIQKNNGAWFVNMNKPSNYDTLTKEERNSLNTQIELMIAYKYNFINYNGLRLKQLNIFTDDGRTNPFDNKVVIIDEVHNLISRIVNKIDKTDSVAYRIYKYLMEAQNAKIVLLSGTPIINYPNEIGILFNIVRGFIKTYKFKIKPETTGKVDIERIKNIFKTDMNYDYIDYSTASKELIFTKNPIGFRRSLAKDKAGNILYNGVKQSTSELDDETFIRSIKKTLTKNNILYESKYVISQYKALPDTLDKFKALFINDDYTMKNADMFKRRIVGLTSYLSDMDKLLPVYNDSRDHLELIPMSDYQINIYQKIRKAERDNEKRTAKKRRFAKLLGNIYEDTSSSYRVFSRLACNFVFPEDIIRPVPSDFKNTKDGEKDIDAFTELEAIADTFVEDASLDIATSSKIATYESEIAKITKLLSDNKHTLFTPDNLALYSPKFLKMIQNIMYMIDNPDKDMLHLVYSQFRTLEGIGIFRLILEAYGFAQFKIKKDERGSWELNMPPEDLGKPKYILYTGTENPEEKEILRNIFNSTWGNLEPKLVEQLQAISSNNLYGEIIKLIMITASGAEGISLRNVGYVHLMESYWHKVRLEQVIGRARRICSHQDLPKEKQTVDVFQYLMTFSKEQKDSEDYIDLMRNDISKEGIKPVTSDETLYEISEIKSTINSNILKNIKESAFDCVLHNYYGSKDDKKDKLTCFSTGNPNKNMFMYKPDYETDDKDKFRPLIEKTITWKGKGVRIGSKETGYKYYVRKPGTDEIYDLESYKRGKLVRIGYLDKKDREYFIRRE